MNRSVPAPLSGWLLAIAMVLASFAAHGADAPGGFSADELRRITPMLQRFGVVALSETGPDGKPVAMTLAVRIHASRQTAFSVFENPESFHLISSLFRENKVLQSHENSKAFSWASRHKLFSFTGTNAISLFPPRRVDVSIVKSTVGSGDFRLLFYEDGPEHTICVLSGFLDVDSSEWLLKVLLAGNPAMREAMNIGVGLVVIKGVKALAEQLQAGKPPRRHQTRGRPRGGLQPLGPAPLARIAPLLERGTVVITSSLPGGRLRQATVVRRMKRAAPRQVIAAVAAPELYPKMIGAIAEAQVHERTEKVTDFSWTLGFKVFGISSRNTMTFDPGGVTILGQEGDLKGARWRWQVRDDGQGGSIVAYHSWADVARAAYILDKSVKREPYLEHGFLAGSGLVMLSGVERAISLPR